MAFILCFLIFQHLPVAQHFLVLKYNFIMNTRTFSSAILFSFGFFLNLNAQSNIIFVSPSPNHGNGKNWDNAFNNLQDALRAATNGSEIWVASGTYLPTKGTDRGTSFVIPNGVKLFGGFAGTEKTAAQRNVAQNPTILSGNIGSQDAEDNTYNVIYTRNVSESTVLDGFIVSGGYANGEGTASNRQRSGGAWYNEGSAQGQSNPTITNCTFIDNFAKVRSWV